MSPAVDKDALNEITTLRQAVKASRELLQQLREKVEPEDQELIDTTVSDSGDLSHYVSLESPINLQTRADLVALRRRPSGLTHRYLGEVSDVSFFNSVKELLQSDVPGHRAGLPLESYEGEAVETLETLDDANVE